MRVVAVGDVVGSRAVVDQRRLLDGLAAAVEQMPARSATATTGDEFQAIFDDLPAAVRAVAALRLQLLDEPPAEQPVELRVGFGVGEVIGPDIEDAGAPGQSGSAWWHARAALDHVARRRRAWPLVRWWVDGDPDVAATRAVLVALDTLAARFDPTDVSLARGLLSGEVASGLAGRVGISRQAVSERLHDHGVYGWLRTLQTLTGEAA